MRTAMRLALVKCEEEEKEETTVEWAQFAPNNGRASSESVAAATLIERASVYCPASCNLWGDEKERRKEGRKEGRPDADVWMTQMAALPVMPPADNTFFLWPIRHAT